MMGVAQKGLAEDFDKLADEAMYMMQKTDESKCTRCTPDKIN